MNEFDLHNHPKIGSGFKIPDNYFDQLSDKILAQLPENETKVIPFSSHRKSWMYAASAVLVLALTIPIYNTLKKPAATVDKATLENYLANHANITTADVAELLDEEDLSNIKIESDIEDKTIEDLLSTNSDLEDYLIN